VKRSWERKRNSDTELIKWSGARAGLSEVRWTRTIVGGPNYLGGSVIMFKVYYMLKDTIVKNNKIYDF
jgi:hypothetical protein